MEDCVSPPYVETFNSKLIKRFRTWTRSSYVFLRFLFFIYSICLFCTWPYSCIWLRNNLLVKKRIKTRRLTNIYHSDDDDVGDGYNLLSSLSLSLSLSLGPYLSSQDRRQQSHCANFLSTVFWLAFAIGYSQKRDFSNITVFIRVLCLARITRVQHYSRFYGMFNGSEGGRTKTIRSKQHRCIIPRYIYELLATKLSKLE